MLITSEPYNKIIKMTFIKNIQFSANVDFNR